MSFTREEMLFDICKSLKDEAMTLEVVTNAARDLLYNGPLIFVVPGRGDELWALAEKLGKCQARCQICALSTCRSSRATSVAGLKIGVMRSCSVATLAGKTEDAIHTVK